MFFRLSCFFLYISLLTVLSNCQNRLAVFDGRCPNDSRIDSLVSRIANSDIAVNYSYAPMLKVVGTHAVELLRIGPNASCKLKEALAIEKKAIISHVILSQIFESSDSLFFEVTANEPPDSGELILKYNGLRWTSKDVDKGELQKVRAYWSKKLEYLRD